MELALADLLDCQREHIIARWTERVLAEAETNRSVDLALLRNSLPEFLQRVAAALRRQAPQTVTDDEHCTDDAAREHGRQRYHIGFDLRALVIEYNVLREVVFDTIDASGLPMRLSDVRVLAAAFARGVAEAVDQYVAERDSDLAALATEQQRASEFERQLIGIVSHDLRNPLAAILLSAEAALRPDDLDPITTRHLRRIQTGAQRATRLIRDLLDYTDERKSGRIPVRPEPMSLRDLVYEAIDEASSMFPGRVINITYGGPNEACLDADRMAQVLSNLLTNALKFSPEATPVTVAVRVTEDTVFIEIHNSGPPIPADRLSAIFEAFQRADPTTRTAGSLGLGLHISRQIVIAHGGALAVRSDAKDGTTFTCTLPREATARRE